MERIDNQLTAEEARRMSTPSLSDAYAKIRAAIKYKGTYTWVTNLSTASIQHLRSNGFTVKQGTASTNRNKWMVSW